MALLDPFRLRSGAALRNHLALAPLTNQQSHPDGRLSDEEHAWLVRRAAGGFGLVLTAATHVAPEGQGFDGQMGVWGDHQLPGLTRLASAVREAGGVPVAQLFHGGVRSPSRLTGRQPVSASVFHEDSPGFEVPRALTDAEIEGVVAQFVGAARRVAAAGFGGVELHGAHGYLLGQFLSSTQNTRDDSWGGDPARRAALVRRVARDVRAAVPAPFAVGVRLSLEDFGNAKGLDLDECVAAAAGLAEDGVDYVHLSLWNWRRNTKKRPDQHPVPLVRGALPADVAIVAAGDVWTADDADQLSALGADIVCVGRAAIVDPDWPRHVVAERAEPIRGPRTPEQLAEVAVSPAFVTYLRRFRDLVAP